MNSVSVTGKKWSLRKFSSEDIDFIKSNYFLDEITSKLLAIRKIKREEIRSKIATIMLNNVSAEDMTLFTSYYVLPIFFDST